MTLVRLARRAALVVILSSLCVATADLAAAEPRHTGHWNMAALKQAPQAEFGATSDNVQVVYYDGEPYHGRPTKIFAYYARPKSGAGPFPAMLCVHGGGGKAFREWAELWAERGYVALAMDLAGKGPDGKPHPDAGPDQGDDGKFGECTPATLRDMWSYHAVAAVVRGHSLLASRPEVDQDRIGITGISWGGYLTCIVAGIDDRLKCAVPVYGCGFLGENSSWLERFAKMPPEQSKLWLEEFDPSQYLGGATCPMLFVNGTNDKHYPPDSYQKSYRLPKGPVTLCIRVGMKHGHYSGWAPIEIGIFADSIFKGGEPLPKIGEIIVRKSAAGADSAQILLGHGIAKAIENIMSGTPVELHYAVAEGPWQKREWKSTSQKILYNSHVPGGGVSSRAAIVLPAVRPLVFYMTQTDDRGALVSTPHLILEE